MNSLEKFVTEEIKKIVPVFEVLEVRFNVGDSSYSMEFFVTIDGKRMQCYDMVDDGTIIEEMMDEIFDSIAKYTRVSETYKSGEINKTSFRLEMQK